MTPQEALEHLKNKEFWWAHSWRDDFAEVAMDALVKQIPKRPHPCLIKDTKHGTGAPCEYTIYICPTGEHDTEPHYNGVHPCEHCGQLIDWRENT